MLGLLIDTYCNNIASYLPDNNPALTKNINHESAGLEPTLSTLRSRCLEIQANDQGKNMSDRLSNGHRFKSSTKVYYQTIELKGIDQAHIIF